MKNRNVFLLSLMLVTLWGLTSGGPATAQGNSDQWQFQLAPYAWLAGLNGKMATISGLPASDVDVDFYEDVLDNINGALFLVGEARKGRWGGLMDIAYTDIEDEDATPKQIFWTSSNVRTKTWMVSAAGLYRVIEKRQAFMDVIGGVRYWNIDTELVLRPGILPGQKASTNEDWFDPIIGLKGATPLGASKFFVSGGLVLGGFTLGSDFMMDANANIGYQWTKGFATTVGYRYLDVEYENGGFLYDVVQDGILLGLSWRF